MPETSDHYRQPLSGMPTLDAPYEISPRPGLKIAGSESDIRLVRGGRSLSGNVLQDAHRLDFVAIRDIEDKSAPEWYG